MFTGIVQEIGRVESVAPGATYRLHLAIASPAPPFATGESIAVDGACLTVTAADGGRFQVEATPETLRRTTLGDLGAGAAVNIERALCLGDRLGGHLVLGHVDAVSRIVARRPEGDSAFAELELPPALALFTVEKGSVAVDGVSLTIASLGRDRFGVALIPETLRRTTLGSKVVGAAVNLEADILGKYVARLLGRAVSGAPRLDEEFLRRAGFA